MKRKRISTVVLAVLAAGSVAFGQDPEGQPDDADVPVVASSHEQQCRED